MKILFSFFLSTIVIINCIAQQDSKTSYRLPDGTRLEYWHDKTEYTKTYYVNKHHPQASDHNPGSFDKPFETINHAAKLVKAGEKVQVYSGTYRECVKPAYSGTSATSMIAFEAAHGAEVIIKGSIIFNGIWQPSTAVLGFNYGRDIWQTPLDKKTYAPFYMLNANNEEMALMPWAEKWTGLVPYILRRGLVFQDGKQMIQLANYEDLLSLEGTFWIDEKNQLLHLHPFENKNPNECAYDLTNQEQLFVPKNIGTNYIHVSGFIFEHAANGFPRIGTGAVFVNGGHHWIFENNVIRNINSVGIEAGARTKEKKVSSNEENERVENHPGGFIIRNNEIYNCGTGGIQGHTVRNSLLEKNHLHHIGWQHAEQYWECAAIKMLRNVNNVVAHNSVHDVNEASGIWLDWDNRNSRVTGNLLYNIGRTSNGAIFIEASIVPNMVDNNIIWGAKGPGISLYDTDDANVCYNLVAFTETPLSSRVNTNRSLNGVPLTSKNNIVNFNIFYQNSELPVIQDSENISNKNLFVSSDLNEWQKSGFDKESKSLEMTISFAEHNQMLIIESEIPLPEVTNSLSCTDDFWGKERLTEKTIPAPWQMNMTGLSNFRLNK